MKSSELAAELSTVVFESLRSVVTGVAVARRELDTNINLIQRETEEDELRILIGGSVCVAYWGSSFSFADIEVAVTAAIDKLKQIRSLEQARDAFNRELLEHKSRVFKAPYVGSADAEFRSYLARCCSAYRHWKSDHRAPCLAITQSSGFGKSRILQRLAETTAAGELLGHGDDRFAVTVLYVCARNVEGSTGYPRATSALVDWLFPAMDCKETSVAYALLSAFKCAITDACTGERWKGLFDNKEINGKRVDVTVVDELKNVKNGAGTSRLQAKKQWTSESIPSQCEANTAVSVLVVAIDEARALLEITQRGVSAFQVLGRALGLVNGMETVKTANGMVFAVLCDTDPQVHGLVPAFAPITSWEDNDSLFPPFVLTQTMDARLASSVSNRSRVLNTDEDKVWETLVAMGRPLWYSMQIGGALDAKKRFLNNFAASTLLLRHDPTKTSSYSDSTLHGAASLFCRVGLRPRTSDPLATRLVADFMSVLHYVTYKKDALITSYSSDPILTFGASYMWYQLSPPALESHILPQFQAMLTKDVVDTANIREIVARIFLLLAMDATIMGHEVLGTEVARKEFVFSGQFCEVSSFVKTLVGENPAVRANESTPSFKKENVMYANWLKQWKEWRVGFSHFVEMSDTPTEDLLWKMLDRRAAGISPPDAGGAVLTIPIFYKGGNDDGDQQMNDTAASFILVQLGDQVEKNDEHPTIRLCMSPCEEPTDKRPARCVLLSRAPRTRSSEGGEGGFDVSLCIRGMFAPSSAGNPSGWSFLTAELTKQLQVIANSNWQDAKTQIEWDLDNAETDAPDQEPLPRTTAMEVAMKTLHPIQHES